MSGLTPAPDVLPFDSHPSISERFNTFHRANPAVYAYLVRLARDWRQVHGDRRCSIDLLFGRLRWEFAMTTTGDQAYKLNNTYRSRYARLIMAREADLADVFEVRGLRAA